MATHTVEIEARLKTQDVERTLRDLNSKAQAESSSSSGQSGTGQLKDAINDLRAAIVSSGVIKSLDDLGKSLGTLGSSAQTKMSGFLKSLERTTQAAAAGGPWAAALVASLELLGGVFKKLSENAEAARQRMEDYRRGMSAARTAEQGRIDREVNLKQGLEQYRADRRQTEILNSDSWGLQAQYLGKLRDRRKELLETANFGLSPEASYKGSRAAQEGLEALEEVKKIDAVISQLEGSLKRLSDASDREKEVKEEATRRERERAEQQAADLEKVRQSWGFGRELDEAQKNRNTQWINYYMGLASQRMGSAKSVTEFNEAASMISSLEQARKNVEDANRRDAEKAAKDREDEFKTRQGSLQDRLKFLTGLGSPVSGFSAAGFSMGEVDPMRNIENQIDQIIRLMYENQARQAQYVNQPTI